MDQAVQVSVQVDQGNASRTVECGCNGVDGMRKRDNSGAGVNSITSRGFYMEQQVVSTI